MVEFSNIKNKMSISLLKGDKDIYSKYFNTIKNSPILLEMFLLSQDLSKVNENTSTSYQFLVLKKVQDKLSKYSKKNILAECDKLRSYDIDVILNESVLEKNKNIDNILFNVDNVSVLSESFDKLNKIEDKKPLTEDINYNLFFTAHKNVITELTEGYNETELLIVNSIYADENKKQDTFKLLKESVIKNINDNKANISADVLEKSINKINSLQYNQSSYIDDIYTLYSCL